MAPPLPVQEPEPAPQAPGPDVATVAAINLNFYRAKNERLMLLLNFLQVPVNGDDENVVSAHNLATATALQCIRTIASADLQK